MSDFENLTPVSNTRMKASKPDLYDGTRNKLEAWILQLDLYFHALDMNRPDGEETEDKEKVIFAATYMRGQAAEWIQPHLGPYLAGENAEGDVTDQIIESYDRFKKELRLLFGIANKVPLAERALQNLRQTRSAAEYAAEFKHYAVQVGWDDAPLMVLYRQGLKPLVRKELLRSNIIIGNMKEMYEESIRIDADWFDLNRELNGNSRALPSHGNASAHQRPPPRQRDPYGYQPMEGIQYGRSVNTLEKGRMKGNGFHKPTGFHKPNKSGKFGKTGNRTNETRTCFTCGKPGHIARNCRSKNKVIRQLNVLAIDDDQVDEEEWEVVSGCDDTEQDEADSPDSRLYEDPEESITDSPPIIPRSPTPHPAAKGKEPINVWDYLEPNQPRDGDLAMGTALYLDGKTPLDAIQPINKHSKRIKLITLEDRKWADTKYLH